MCVCVPRLLPVCQRHAQRQTLYRTVFLFFFTWVRDSDDSKATPKVWVSDLRRVSRCLRKYVVHKPFELTESGVQSISDLPSHVPVRVWLHARGLLCCKKTTRPDPHFWTGQNFCWVLHYTYSQNLMTCCKSDLGHAKFTFLLVFSSLALLGWQNGRDASTAGTLALLALLVGVWGFTILQL